MLKEDKAVPKDVLEANAFEPGKPPLPKQATLGSVAKNTLREALYSIGVVSEKQVDQVPDNTLGCLCRQLLCHICFCIRLQSS